MVRVVQHSVQCQTRATLVVQAIRPRNTSCRHYFFVEHNDETVSRLAADYFYLTARMVPYSLPKVVLEEEDADLMTELAE